MGGPKSGKYWIQQSYYHRLRLGVDDHPGPVQPVISYGYFNSFVVKKLEDGKYIISVEENGSKRSIQAHGDHVVANDHGPASVWEISGPENGPYTIEVPNVFRPTKGWTTHTADPYARLPVTLQWVEIPTSDQKFDFIPLGPSED